MKIYSQKKYYFEPLEQRALFAVAAASSDNDTPSSEDDTLWTNLAHSTLADDGSWINGLWFVSNTLASRGIQSSYLSSSVGVINLGLVAALHHVSSDAYNEANNQVHILKSKPDINPIELELAQNELTHTLSNRNAETRWVIEGVAAILANWTQGSVKAAANWTSLAMAITNFTQSLYNNIDSAVNSHTIASIAQASSTSDFEFAPLAKSIYESQDGIVDYGLSIIQAGLKFASITLITAAEAHIFLKKIPGQAFGLSALGNGLYLLDTKLSELNYFLPTFIQFSTDKATTLGSHVEHLLAKLHDKSDSSQAFAFMQPYVKAGVFSQQEVDLLANAGPTKSAVKLVEKRLHLKIV